MSLAARRIISVALLLLGSIGLCCGVIPGVIFPLVFDADIARVEALRPISFVAFEDGAPGREVLVEGVLSPRNPASPEGLIIYTRSVATTDSDGDRTWREVESVRPAVILELQGGVVPVRAGYSLDGSLPTQIERPGERLNGVMSGATVIVVGTLAEGPEGIELQAELLSVGTREEYLTRNRQLLVFFRVFGYALLCGGILLFGGGLLLLVRSFLRGHPGPGQPPQVHP